MKSLGERLRRERERRGVALDDVADATKIARRHLEALERNDLKSLPGTTFNRGFVRAYAQFLGLDADPLVEAYSAEERAQGHREPSEQEIAQELSRAMDLREGRPASDGRIPRARALAVGVSLVLLVVAGWLWLSRTPGGTRTPEAPPVATPGPPEETPATVVSPADETPAPSVPTGPAEPPPVPAPEAEPGAAAAPAPNLSIAGSGVGRDVVDRQLVGRTGRFSPGETVWFWTRVVGGAGGELLRHVWMQDGRPIETLTFTIGGPHWRVYSRKTMGAGSSGEWTVEARDASGRVLARQEFTCSAEEG